MILHLDFETRSRIDLCAHGAYLYSRSPSTEIICMAWAIDDGPVELWWPGSDFPVFPLDILREGAPRSIHAHNAQFERLIINHVLALPSVPIEAFYCTATQARRRALPGALDGLGKALKLDVQKQLVGKQLIRKLCIPWLDGKIDWENGKFNKDPELLTQMGEYCVQDVEVERLAAQMSPPMTDDEQAEYVLSEKINDRGLMIDYDLAEAAAGYATAETDQIGLKLTEMTGGAITRPRQFARLKTYLEPYVAADNVLRKLITRHKTDRKTGETTVKQSLDKTSRRNILDSEPGVFDPAVVGLVSLIDEAGRSSTSKFTSMCLRSDPDDDRVRGAYISNGASQTGRHSSVGLQVHNMTRDCADDPEGLRAQILDGAGLEDPMNELASMLRPSIVAADGHVFVCGDWSSIEARVLPWLSNDYRGKQVLDQHKLCDANPDLPDMYVREAEKMYPGRGEENRQIGKVAILSLGYQGGIKAFQSMARNYGLAVDDAAAEVVRDKWRRANPWAPKFWAMADKAVMDAVRHPGTDYHAGMLRYVYSVEWNALYCVLPSGKTLSYPFPRIELVKTPWGEEKEAVTVIKANWKPAAGENEWPRVSLYGGMVCENATQAVAGEILNHGLGVMDRYDWPVVGHTHDEILCEVLMDEAEDCSRTLRWAMERGPAWSDGLPLACSLWTGGRYRK